MKCGALPLYLLDHRLVFRASLVSNFGGCGSRFSLLNALYLFIDFINGNYESLRKRCDSSVT